MSYYICITRDPYFEADDALITLEEWRRLALDDPEFDDRDESGSLDQDGSTFYWKTHPDRPLFCFFSRSGIGVRQRDEAIFRRMFDIAGKLGAVLRGEQGELYRLTKEGVEQYYEDPDDGQPTLVCWFDR